MTTLSRRLTTPQGKTAGVRELHELSDKKLTLWRLMAFCQRLSLEAGRIVAMRSLVSFARVTTFSFGLDRVAAFVLERRY